MRILRSQRPLACFLVLLTTAPCVPCQDPPATEAPVVQAPAAASVLVLKAGTVHPVSGPAIRDGVVVIRGERIVAVGAAAEVEVPPDATVRSFPDGHLYPGLIDAQTDAFTDTLLRGDGGLDAGLALADGLRVRGDRDDELVQNGITTAYVSVRSAAAMRGQGTIVRPGRDGFQVWSGKQRAGVQMRMTAGPVASHPLQRQQQLDGTANLFDGLEEYRKAKTDHAEAMTKYEKEFAEYLAFHQKKKDAAKPGAPAEAAPSTTPPGPGGEAPPGERRRPPGRGGPGGGPTPPNGGNTADADAALDLLLAVLAQDLPKQDPPKQDPPKPAPGQNPPAPAGNQQPAPAEKPAEKKDEGPARPTFPKPPAKDPAKDALLCVLDGQIPLRIEAHRPEELRAALLLQTKYNIPLLVLEQAYGASAVAEAIAAQGASAVLTEVLPNSMPKIYEAFDPQALPAKLNAAGVPFAIASGSARRAGLLPLMAAAAIGKGLDRDAALRAITQWPAEILGVGKDTGTLQTGKYGDVLACDRPLFASDCRVLLVCSKGLVEFEAK